MVVDVLTLPDYFSCPKVLLQGIVKDDMERFIKAMKSQDVDLRALGFARGTQADTILAELQSFYGLAH